MKQHLKQQCAGRLLLSGAFAAGIFGSAVREVKAQAAENIALGKSVTFSIPPNYALCSDPEDDKQITDGLRSSQGDLKNIDNTTSIWVQKGTVGWTGAYPIITIDLGKVQPISGVSYSTAAGRAGVSWPSSVYISVSDDSKEWHHLGDLTALSEQKPPAADYAAFQYATHALHTKGRYVAISIASSQYTFVDEIEVYRGE